MGYANVGRIEVACDRDCWRAALNVVNKLRFVNAPYRSLPEFQNSEMKIFRVKVMGPIPVKLNWLSHV